MKVAFRYLALVFFFLMLVLPTTFQLQRGILLAFLTVMAVVAAIRTWRVDQTLFTLFLLTLTASVFHVIWGYVHSTPGALRVMTVYIAWPVVYMLFVGLARRPEVIVSFEKALILGIIGAGAMGLFLVIGAIIGKTRVVSDILAFQGGAVGLYDGFIVYRLFNMMTVIYGLPFLMALHLLLGKSPWFSTSWRWSSRFALLLTLLVCVVSGRRAFWALAVLTPFIVVALFVLAGVNGGGRRMVWLSFTAFPVVIGVFIGFGIDPGLLAARLLSAFEFLGEKSGNVRSEQFVALIAGWIHHPVLGNGLGASAETVVRNPLTPWAYELSYVALLFQTGLLGVLIYITAVLWIFYAGIRIVRSRQDAAPVIIPLLAGLAGILLVNATNPYLQKFDYLWTIFLPVAAVNVYRSHPRVSISSSSTGTRENNWRNVSRL